MFKYIEKLRLLMKKGRVDFIDLIIYSITIIAFFLLFYYTSMITIPKSPNSNLSMLFIATALYLIFILYLILTTAKKRK